MHDGDVASLGRTDHLAVVSAYWEVHDERWRSKTRSKPAEYYRRPQSRSRRRSLGRALRVYTAAGSNDCEGLEATYRQGYKQADTEDRPVEKEQRPRFICAKLPLRKLHYDDWHLADHSLVQNMPCAEKMRHETHLAQQDQPRGICGAHADPQGRRARDADGVGGRGSALGAERRRGGEETGGRRCDGATSRIAPAD